jgi:hypothetical protein
MHPTGIGKPQTNSAVRAPGGLAAALEIALVGELEIAPVAVEAESQAVVIAQAAGELEHDLVAEEPERDLVVEEPEHDLVAEELERDLAAEEPEHDPVVAALEHVQAEAELELVRAAVPLRTKSVIAPHHRGLVPVLGAEDLAAEVETTREPAAIEAVVAWAAVVTAVAAVADVVVE